MSEFIDLSSDDDDSPEDLFKFDSPTTPLNINCKETEDEPEIVSFINKFVEEKVEDFDLTEAIDNLRYEYKSVDKEFDECEELLNDIKQKVKEYGDFIPESTIHDVVVYDKNKIIIPGPVLRIVPYDEDGVIPEASYKSDEKSVTIGSSSVHLSRENQDDDEVFLKSGESEHDPKLIPPKGDLYRPNLKVGDYVYTSNPTAGKKTELEWKLGEIKKISRNEDGKLAYMTKFVGQKKIPELLLLAKRIAYRESQTYLIPVKTRVIAYYRKETSIPISDCPILSGMVAETPHRSNKYRYLIFFDSGNASYCGCEEVFLIVENSFEPWKEVPDEDSCAAFINYFCKELPDRPIIRCVKSEKLKVKIKDKWMYGEVKDIDGTLVKLHFNSIDEDYWIYLGSFKLRMIYDRFVQRHSKLLNLSTSLTPKRKLIPRKALYEKSILNKKISQPFIAYTRESDSEEDKENFIEDELFRLGPRKQIAKKSTSKFSTPSASLSPRKQRSTAYVIREKPDQEFVIIKIPDFEPTSSHFISHKCSVNCVKYQEKDVVNLRGYNPYMIPVLFGWDRQTISHKNRFSRRHEEIVYRTPCGRRLRNISEVGQFLEYTKSKLSLDFFTYEFEVKLFQYGPDDLKIPAFHYIEDFSCGEEAQPVSLINFINKESIENFTYTSTRFPSNDIRLPLNKNFLSCCDCTDNCSDRKKCSCQQLTVYGYNCLPGFMQNTEVGYHNKRLLECVLTGVYECNPNCSCNERCVNKVVQRGIQVQLQIFKTLKKGWGVRVLHDVPKGSYICIYAAEVLAAENPELEDRSDVYFAALDLIEIVETYKMDYESNVEFSEDDEEEGSDFNDKSSRERKRKKVNRNEDLDGGKSNRRFPQDRKQYLPIRQYYNQEEPFMLDANYKGNVGRFLNHGCNPTCYVQNVFVDTHDLRFPWVAIFAKRNIKAFEEITWDYGYEAGSVPGRKLYCHCGSSNCRGRLL